MSDGRKRLSDQQYRKLAELKRKKVDKVLHETIKIDNYFNKIVTPNRYSVTDEVTLNKNEPLSTGN